MKFGRTYQDLVDNGSRGFAWLPVRVADGQWVWLEAYLIGFEPVRTNRIRLRKYRMPAKQ